MKVSQKSNRLSFKLPVMILAAVAIVIAIMFISATNTVISSSSIQVYSDTTVAAGIATSHTQMTNYWSVGQAWGDYNGDGWVDLYVTNHNGVNTLYDNNGDGTFTPSAIAADVALASTPSAGAVFADYDNDGDLDLYVSNNGRNTLFRNDGGAAFTDVTNTARVGDPGKSSSASWGDVNGDGLLDLYSTNWRHDACTTVNDPCIRDVDRLYKNNGDGTFSDYSLSLGIYNITGLGFIGSFLDYDNDGDLDLYVVNDSYRNPIGNQLFRNDGQRPGNNPNGLGSPVSCEGPGWCWTEVSADVGANQDPCGMGLAIGDYDRDGDLDMYFSNAPVCGGDGIHHLLQNQTSQGSPTFVDVSVAAGVDSDAVGWGTVFVDYNNDGWLDIYAAQSGPFDPANGVWANNKLYHNNGDGTFTLMDGDGADYSGPTWGVASADYDRDGWVDLVITNRNGSNNLPDFVGHKLYNNMQIGNGSALSSAPPRWQSFDLIGSPANLVNADGVGARITIIDTNGYIHMQELKTGSSLGGGNEIALHFGFQIGKPAQTTIEWPDGTTQTWNSIRPLNTRFTIEYGQDPVAQP